LAYDLPPYSDNFTNLDVLTPNPDKWPPIGKGYAQKWSPIYLTGWPWNAPGDHAPFTEDANGEAEGYDASALSIGPNGLIITATKGGSNAINYPWRSGCIVNTQPAQFGYREAVIRFPNARGCWGAFWLEPASLNWNAEIDIVEALIDKNLTQYPIRVHSGLTGGGVNAVGDWNAANISDGQFHKHGLLWTASGCVIYVDDQPVATWQTPTNKSDGSPADFSQPMYEVINLAIGGANAWPGEPTGDGPYTMEVRRFGRWLPGEWPSGQAIPNTPPVSVLYGTAAGPTITTGGTPSMPTITLSDALAAGTYNLTTGSTAPATADYTLAINGSDDPSGNHTVVTFAVDGGAASAPLTVTGSVNANTLQNVDLGQFDPTKAHTVVMTQTNGGYGCYVWGVTVGTGTMAAISNPEPQTKANGDVATFTIPAQ
jgi:hypothetical protein